MAFATKLSDEEIQRLVDVTLNRKGNFKVVLTDTETAKKYEEVLSRQEFRFCSTKEALEAL